VLTTMTTRKLQARTAKTRTCEWKKRNYRELELAKLHGCWGIREGLLDMFCSLESMLQYVEKIIPSSLFH
jgi:hypothetical protein